MAADLKKLVPGFSTKVQALEKLCASQELTMRPSAGLRDPFEQAKLWRQSRSIEEIDFKIKELKKQEATFLVHCLEISGPQHGGWVTNALPGFSWHQWGEAMDFFWLLDGKAEWSTKKTINGKNGYIVMAKLAKDLGLTAGGYWAKLKDWPHIQMRPESSPLSVYSVAQINNIMAERFS